MVNLTYTSAANDVLFGAAFLHLPQTTPIVISFNPKMQVNLGNSTYERPTYQNGLVLFRPVVA